MSFLNEIQRKFIDELVPTPAEGSNDDEMAGLAPLQSAQRDWGDLLNYVQRQLTALEANVLARVEAHNEAMQTRGTEDMGFAMSDVAAAMRRNDGILRELDSGLSDGLAAAIDAVGNEARAKLQGRVVALVRACQQFIEGDARIKSIDRNGFLATDIFDRTRKTLNRLAEQL